MEFFSNYKSNMCASPISLLHTCNQVTVAVSLLPWTGRSSWLAPSRSSRSDTSQLPRPDWKRQGDTCLTHSTMHPWSPELPHTIYTEATTLGGSHATCRSCTWRQIRPSNPPGPGFRHVTFRRFQPQTLGHPQTPSLLIWVRDTMKQRPADPAMTFWNSRPIESVTILKGLLPWLLHLPKSAISNKKWNTQHAHCRKRK